MAAKRTPWDNISQWEHYNSFTRDIRGYKNIYFIAKLKIPHHCAYAESTNVNGNTKLHTMFHFMNMWSELTFDPWAH